MKLTKRQFLATTLAATLPPAFAQGNDADANYPSRPVNVIVPFPPGTPIDGTCRVVLDAVQRRTGAVFVIENVPGAGSMIGHARVARAKPDGYSLLLGTSSGLAIIPHVNKSANYGPDSFEPIVAIATTPYVLLVPANSPFNTAKELFDAARARPDELAYGSNGMGGSFHLTMEAILAATGTKMRHVPFRGGQDLVMAGLRGDISVFPVSPDALEHVRSGKLKALCALHTSRLPIAPELPTIKEALGLSNLESGAWTTLVAPKGTPAAVVSKLNAWVNEAIKDPQVRETFTKGQFIPEGGTAVAVRTKIKREFDAWGDVIRTNNIQIQ